MLAQANNTGTAILPIYIIVCLKDSWV